MKFATKPKFIIFLLLLNLLLIQHTIGRLIIYPFVILSTWFHEIGHSLAALLLGGEVVKIEIFYDGSGVAYHTNTSIWGNFGRALVALSGPLFPPIVGYFFISTSTTKKLSKLMIFILSVTIIFSVIFWVRNFFGVFFLLLISLFLVYTTLTQRETFLVVVSRIIGVQAFISVYLSIGYLFSTSGIVNQSSFASDTEIVAQNLLLPNWFWGTLIIVITLILLYLALKSVLKKN